MKYYRRRRLIRRKPYRKSRVRKPNVSTKIKRYVKKTLNRNLETKYNVTTGLDYAIPVANQTALQPPLLIDCVPNITQNPGSSTRIGNVIKVNSAVIKGMVRLNAYNATTNPYPCPILVKMWLVRYKQDNTSAPTSTVMSSNFFKGNNTTIGFQGNPLDLLEKVEDDLWQLYCVKQFKLGMSSTVSSGIYSNTGAYDNGSFLHNFSIPLTKHLHRLVYNDNTGSYVTGKNLWLMATAVYCNGTTISTGSVVPASVTWALEVSYKDA